MVGPIDARGGGARVGIDASEIWGRAAGRASGGQQLHSHLRPWADASLIVANGGSDLY